MAEFLADEEVDYERELTAVAASREVVQPQKAIFAMLAEVS